MSRETPLSHKRTLLSLNKTEILQLPGMRHLNYYLYSELKTYIRSKLPEWTKKKRGFTVGEYINTVYKGFRFTPLFRTQRKIRRAATPKVPKEKHAWFKNNKEKYLNK